MVCEEPVLFLYHDLLTTGELDYMKRNALNLLEEALVQDVNQADDSTISNERTQSHGWLYDYQHELLYKLSKKVSLVTGLEAFRPVINGPDGPDWRLIESEDWQVGLYGSGGHYLPHHDAFHEENLPSDVWSGNIWVGNR